MSHSLDNPANLENRYKLESFIEFPTRLGILLAVVSGLLMAAAHEINLPGSQWTAFIAVVPLLIAIDKKRPLTAFLLALLAFALNLAHPLFWLIRYGFFAMAGLVFMESVAYSLAFLIYNFIRERMHWRDPWLLSLPMLIAIVEFKRSIGPWAFPWTNFAHSQWGNLIFIQGASIWGALGVGFLIIWVNVFLYQLIKAFPNHPSKLSAGIPLIVVMSLNLIYGHNMLVNDDFKNSQAYPVTVTQRAGTTDVSWTLNYNDKAWMDYHNLTRSEIDKTQGTPGFVLWPENSIPDLIENRLEALKHLANASKKAFIVGTLTYKPEDADYNVDYDKPWFEIYNSNVSISPDFGYSGTYSKSHLVPFGETIPMREYLAILEYPWGDKNLKEGRTINALMTPYGGVGTMVCYESFFPQISRKLILDGAKYLFLSSNTSWFGDSIATWQHSRYDVFRAVENGCYFARAATTGVSSVIDPRGRILHETGVFVSDAFTEDIHPLQPNYFGATTIYTVTGDWIAYLSLIWFVFVLMKIFRPKTAKPLSESIVYIED